MARLLSAKLCKITTQGHYQYRVRKGGYQSDRLPAGGFVVDPPPPGDDQTIVHTMP